MRELKKVSTSSESLQEAFKVAKAILTQMPNSKKRIGDLSTLQPLALNIVRVRIKIIVEDMIGNKFQ